MASNPASTILWEALPNFSPSEFDHVDLENLDEEVLYELQDFRTKLGKKVFPSPLADAWVRFDGSKTSRHYAVGRLSTAGDVFPDCHIAEAFLTAMRTKFNGIGIYLDTHYDNKPWPMLHLDVRPFEEQAIWLREKVDGKTVYTTFYPHRDPAVLCQILEKLSKVK